MKSSISLTSASGLQKQGINLTLVKNLTYSLACLAFSVIIGAAIFEHLVIWPKAYAAPPQSLSMFQGNYGVNPGIFWTMIHPVTLLIFIVNLIWNWKTPRKTNLLIAFAGYFLILVATGLYFVPELMDILGADFADRIDSDLVARGSKWQILSSIRLVGLIALAFVLYLGLTKTKD